MHIQTFVIQLAGRFLVVDNLTTPYGLGIVCFKREKKRREILIRHHVLSISSPFLTILYFKDYDNSSFLFYILIAH